VQGIQGALYQMLSHGFVSAALFLVVGVLYDRLHTHEIARFSGLADRMPGYALIFMVFMMASMGLPGTSGFVGEFLVILGSFQINFWLALLGGMGMILGAAYMLYLYRRIIFGRLTKQDLRNILDLSPREWAVFAPLIVLTFWMGIYPSSFSGFWDASVAAMVKQHTAAMAAHEHTALATVAPRFVVAGERPTTGVMAGAVRPGELAGGRPSTKLLHASEQVVDRGPSPAMTNGAGPAPAMTAKIGEPRL